MILNEHSRERATHALRDKRLIIVALLLAALAAEFWTGSRYPALNEKLLMGTDTPLSGLAFSTVVDIAPDEKVLPRILYETVNWTYTNRQGMTFGILFGALLMTLLRLLDRRGARGPFGNTVVGMLIGTPLGVCVNCAAPIAKAIHAAGGRVETMLAVMFSSPTLNVIVLTMLFALFPVYMALIKIALTVGFILIGIPLLTRFLRTPGTAALGEALSVSPLPRALEWIGSRAPDGAISQRPEPVGSWRKALFWVLGNFAASLWFLIKTTVPLMILAGFLGSAFVTVLPLESLSDSLPSTGRMMTLLAMGAVALVGIFLPVPMSFDVIVTAILWQAGLPVKYVMVLLFTLGIFSIFPFFIIWKALGKWMATSLFVGLAGLGVLAGILGHELFKWDFGRQQQLIFEVFRDSSASLRGPMVVQVGGETRLEMPDGELVSSLQRTALAPQPIGIASADAISVGRIAFQAPLAQDRVAAGPGKLFSRFEGRQFGLDEPYSFSVLKFWGPSAFFRGVASGDVHNDGWIDILLTSDSGLSLYANRQGRGFVLQRIDIPELKSFHVVNAALVDLNNDGLLDIFFSTYRHGNYVIYNRQGRFTKENLRRLPDQQDAIMTGAAAFGDVNNDGELDIVLGTWAPVYHGGSAITANKVLLLNDKGRFKVRPMYEVPGPTLILQTHQVGNRSMAKPLKEFRGPTLSRQTLSILLSDINDDGILDLIIGNEDLAPDSYHFGNGDGSFRQITRGDGIIPYSTATTMSVASADINNDLLPEIYLGQISASKSQTKIRDIGPDICDEIAQPAHKKSCQEMIKLHQAMPKSVRKAETALDVRQCLSIDRKPYREDCMAYSLLVWTIRNGPQNLCNLFSDSWESFRFICHFVHDEKTKSAAGALLSGKMSGSHKSDRNQAIPALIDNNVLLTQTGNGRFADKAGELGVQKAGFTWNARFADLDNDEFVDLYAVNGWIPSAKRESHYFYHNQHGKSFVEKTEDTGLVSFLPTSSYTYVDLDNDGDLDIVSVPISGPVLVYINNSKNKRIAFELRDYIGNRFGIGSKIIIHYGAGGTRHQMREIQASGGFISFDAPIAYFGLGEFQRVEIIEVRWSTGERSEIRGDFPAGARYVIERRRIGGAQ